MPLPAAKFVGNLTLGSSSGKKPLYTFGSLHVTGSLTINGDAFTRIERLYVGGTLTVTAGPGKGTLPDQEWGSVFVQGDVSITSGHFLTIDILATNGQVNVGSGASSAGRVGNKPKPTLFVLANDGKDFKRMGSGDAIFYGVVYTKTGNVNVTSGNSGAFTVSNGVVSMPRQPFLRGAVFAGGNVVVKGGASVAYDADVMSGLPVTRTVPVMQIVPGTWQELSPSGE